MNSKAILIVTGEPNSVFSEILIKSLKKTKVNKPVIIITSYNLLNIQLQKLKLNSKIHFKLIKLDSLSKTKLRNKSINVINVDFNQNKAFKKISKKSNKFINDCFELAFELIKKQKITRFINGPISKKHFLKKKYFGVTEYISDYFSKKNTSMLIYNKDLSVCPLTTHLPIKLVPKFINKKNIKNKVILINKFYKKFFNRSPKVAILGLNPHCESILKYNEDEKIIKPLIFNMKKNGYKLYGPLPADTAFIKENRKKYDVFIGNYHDQVLTPIKTIYEYDAINITLGLPFLRISPDHGPNEKMMGKNLSNPLSLIQAIKFLDTH
ncbi:4-hydroxythreonine-4-phosphate dehydrogenase PdxA [Candidatus Pelagibacter sp.]|uniref:4-hydroxythreonine-4-phosphate dehydrogenase PdxA n=1 Tax=Candidatus Pelagibacter sp. TaxID=2024849 RepID=UPI003F834D23